MAKRILFSVLFFLCAGVPAWAAPLSPCLTLRDGAGQPLAYAHVHIPELQLTATTDASGRVCLHRVPAGSYVAEVHYPGYARTTLPLTLAADGEQTLEVVLKNYSFESVVLTGRSQGAEARRAPQASVSLSGDALRRQAGSNLVEAIGVLPGVSGLGTGPAVMKPIIRGLSYNRVVTIGPTGLRQEGQQWGDEHGLEVDPYAVERVEVLKGPASLAYGSDALGGVLHLQAAPLPTDGNSTGLFNVDYQSNGGLFGFSGRYARAAKGFVYGFQTSYRTARPYSNAADGRVHNSGFNEFAGRFTLGVQRSRGSSVINASYFDQRWGMPEGERDTVTGQFLALFNNNGADDERPATDADLRSYALFFPQQRIRHSTLAWTTNALLGRTRLIATLGYQLNQRGEFESAVEGTEAAALGWHLHTGTYDVKLVLPAFAGGWRTTVGVGGMLQRSRNTGEEEFLTPDYRLFDGGVYGILERSWDRLTLSGGLRVDFRSISAEGLALDTAGAPLGSASAPAFGEQRFTGFERTFSALTGSLGASYAVSPSLSLKANVARGYRAPNIAELAANGAHEGTLRYEYGNPSLRPEASLQGDLGIEWRSDWVTLGAAVFYNYISNYIFVEKLLTAAGTDSVPDANEPENLAYRFTQADEANLFGGELSVALTPVPLPGLTLESSYSLVRGRALGSLARTDSTRFLPFIPAPRWRTELRYERTRAGAAQAPGRTHVRSWFVSANYDHYFAQNEVLAAAGTELTNPAYGLLGASAGLTIADGKGKPRLTFMLIGTNLTDEIYQNHLSRLRYADVNRATGRRGIFGAGSNLSLRLVVPL